MLPRALMGAIVGLPVPAWYFWDQEMWAGQGAVPIRVAMGAFFAAYPLLVGLLFAWRSRERSWSQVRHDLKTPLVPILGYSEMILDGRLGEVNDRQKNGLEAVARNARKMAKLIDSV